MRYTSNVYEVDGRWEYDILSEGTVIIHQDCDPDLPGQEPMTQERAGEAAAVVLARLA